MPLNIPPIAINNVWRRTGTRRVEHSFPRSGSDLATLTAGKNGGPLGIFLAWRLADFDFFDTSASARGVGGTKSETFSKGWPAVQQVLQQLRVRAFNHAPDFPTKHQFVSGQLPADGTLLLRFSIDTDAEAFRKLDRARNAPETDPVLIEVLLGAFDSGSVFDHGVIRLEVRPAVLPGDFNGFAALDMGNAATALTFLPSGFLSLDRFGSVPADDDASESTRGLVDAIESVIRIDEATPAGNDPSVQELPGAFDWKIGALVLQGQGSDGVVFGAKRLLAGPDANASMPLHTFPPGSKGHTPRVRVPTRILRRLPGELLVCRLLQRFRQITAGQPPPLALTYPTTFTREEILRLQETVSRAWCRQGARQQTAERIQQFSSQQIKLLIDEASAASFCSLFQTVLGEPGGLTRFAYLFPEGYNLLLYDMGAGTTDLALVKAKALPDGKPTQLEIEVVGRSGLREFGGDEITVAVFLTLKALLAQKMATVLGKNLPTFSDKDHSKLPEYLKRNANQIDELVPTRFNRERMNAEDRTRRASTKALWLQAQTLKHRLEEKKPEDKVETFPQGYSFTNDLWQELNRQVNGEQRVKLHAAAKEIKLTRQLIDTLVRPSIEESVNRCNWLIRNKLQGAAGWADVHRVEIVGNGARYPLVRELLRERLHVAFYQERENFDKDNLKGMVVRGALLALAVREGAPEIRMKFDERVAERLPFDLAYSNRRAGGERPLFREHQLYEDLERQPQTIQLAHEEDGQPARQLFLQRRWPGEKDFQPYLLFPFPKGIQGPVTVSYDPAHGFVAEDENTQVRQPQLLGDTEMYLAPPERGTL